jgi:CO dehydrogenase maturation factor
MRIGFFGKGGSGKTTTTAGFIKYLMKNGSYVLAIDADVNIHLKNALDLNDLSGQSFELGENFKEISAYVKGARTDLGNRPMISSTPPSLLSRFIKVSSGDPFIAGNAMHTNNMALLTVGTYQQEDVGASCYHSKLGSLAVVFHHLLDGPDDYVVADTNAGTDNVATSLAFAYDMNVFVVEPTEKSIKVYKDYVRLAQKLNERTFVIGNKADGQEDQLFIEQNIEPEKLLGVISYSKHLKAFEQGNKKALDLFELEQEQTFERVLAKWREYKRDWKAYLETLTEVHKKNSREWYDAYYGTSLSDGLDQDFQYEKVIDSSYAKEKVLVG